MLTTHEPIPCKQARPLGPAQSSIRSAERSNSIGVQTMLSRWMVLLLLIGLSGCSGLKLQLEVQRDNQTL